MRTLNAGFREIEVKSKWIHNISSGDAAVRTIFWGSNSHRLIAFEGRKMIRKNKNNSNIPSNYTYFENIFQQPL